MQLNSQKELTPVLYGESAVKILPLFSFGPGQACFSAHWHERMELLLVLSGRLLLQLDGRVIAAPAGSLAIIPPEQPHCGTAGETGVDYRVIMFDVPTFYNAAHAVERLLPPIADKRVDFPPVTENPAIVSLAQSLLPEQTGGDAYAPLLVIGRVYELLGLLYRCRPTEPVRSPQPDDRLKQVLDYIAAHCSEPLSSAALSRRFGYDEAYFCRRFKAVTGLSPMAYIRILRLEQARRQLGESDARIADIAAACGFADAGYFARCFRRQFQMTPGEYRTTLRQTTAP